MPRWLFKEEPEHYSFADLQREGETLWDGVTNSLARLNLRKVRKGDLAFFYHTGKVKAIVGEMKVTGDPEHEPGAKDTKAVAVKVAPVRTLPRPVTLAEIKDDAKLAGWDLVRLPRLSVLPVSDEQWQRIEALSRQPKS